MLNNIGLPGLLLIAGVTVLLFGRGKVAALMGELGGGIKAFRRGLREGEIEASRGDEREKPATPAPDA